MPDTGRVPSVDLNADLGESEEVLRTDVALLAVVTSVNVACGFHAGSTTVMQGICRVALERGVVVGAHVSYRDRAGFGRRVVDVEDAQLEADLVEQAAGLSEVARGVGARVRYIKPHGALYTKMGVDPEVASVVIRGVRRSFAQMDAPVLVAQSGTSIVALARRAGVRVIEEAFPDRAYRPDGGLVDRRQIGSVIEDPESVALRARSMVMRGGIEAVDGSWIPLDVDSLCIHGDTPRATESAEAVTGLLETAGYSIRSFVQQTPPSGST
jgi:UPF0271 protein